MIIAGADEVGRGAFAGPVVTAVVVFLWSEGEVRENITKNNIIITDSKKLTQNARELASVWIKSNSYFATGEAWVTDINRVGIVPATNMAYRKAFKTLHKKYNLKIEKLFTDAFYIPYLPGAPKYKQKPVVKGDSKILQISAASIVAKVYRDAIMRELHASKSYSKYLWDQNKGYGTLSHRKAIVQYGACKLHRREFIRSTINNSSFFQAQFGV